MDAINANISRETVWTSYTVLNVSLYKSQIMEFAAWKDNFSKLINVSLSKYASLISIDNSEDPDLLCKVGQE